MFTIKRLQLAWVVAILGLTVVVRLLVLPLYNRQIRSSRQMQKCDPRRLHAHTEHEVRRYPVVV